MTCTIGMEEWQSWFLMFWASTIIMRRICVMASAPLSRDSDKFCQILVTESSFERALTLEDVITRSFFDISTQVWSSGEWLSSENLAIVMSGLPSEKTVAYLSTADISLRCQLEDKIGIETMTHTQQWRLPCEASDWNSSVYYVLVPSPMRLYQPRDSRTLKW